MPSGRRLPRRTSVQKPAPLRNLSLRTSGCALPRARSEPRLGLARKIRTQSKQRTPAAAKCRFSADGLAKETRFSGPVPAPGLATPWPPKFRLADICFYLAQARAARETAIAAVPAATLGPSLVCVGAKIRDVHFEDYSNLPGSCVGRAPGPLKEAAPMERTPQRSAA
eukprot:8299318-Pyramimonas_sp.AAC.1